MEFLLKLDIGRKMPSTGRRVAIVGGGPAGLSAAKELLQLGHEVHVYDMMPEAGGLLLFGIPDYRIDKAKVRDTVGRLKDFGAVFYTDVNVGKDVPLDEIIKGYDAVLIATGAWESNRVNVPGEDLDGVYYALDYIVNYNLLKLGYPNVKLPKLYGHVAVVGGGLTAVDACHIVLQSGVESVSLIYRRGKVHAPAGRKNIENLEASGVRVLENTQPTEFLGEQGRVKMIKAVKTRVVENREYSRFELNIVPNSEHTIPADNILLAVGLKPSLPKTSNNCIKAVKKYRTNMEKVFIAGDALLGPSYIGFALKSGREAAKHIHEFLSGKS